MGNIVLNCKLKVLTPTFIHSGEASYKIQFLKKGNFLYKLYLEKFISYLSPRFRHTFTRQILSLGTNLEQFERYMEELKQEFWNLDKEKRKNSLKEILRNHIPSREFGSAFRSIEEVMKDANNVPYIPGSSLKGAIRTLFIRYILKRFLEENILEEFLGSLIRLSTRNNRFDSKIFNQYLKSFLDTTLLPQFIHISDFYPQGEYDPKDYSNTYLGAYRIYRVPHISMPILSEGYNKNTFYKGKILIDKRYERRDVKNFIKNSLDEYLRKAFRLPNEKIVKILNLILETLDNFEETLKNIIFGEISKDYFNKVCYLKKLQYNTLNRENRFETSEKLRNIKEKLNNFFINLERYKERLQNINNVFPLFIGSYTNFYSKVLFFRYKNLNPTFNENDWDFRLNNLLEELNFVRNLNVFPKTFSVALELAESEKYLIPGLCQITIENEKGE